MLWRKSLRTIGLYKAQFFSMVLMIALGVCIFLGFNMEWVSIERNTKKFFRETGFADYRLMSEKGFSEEDARSVGAIEGVERAARYLSLTADLPDEEGKPSGRSLLLCVTEDSGVSFFSLTEGEEYDAEDEEGVWLFDHFAEENGVRVGDPIVMQFEDYRVEGRVRGLIAAGEQLICVRDESQLMPSYENFGYAYLSPAKLRRMIYDAAYAKAGERFSSPLLDVLRQSAAEVAAKEIYDGIYHEIHVLSDLTKEEFSAAADEALGKTILVLTKHETISYAESEGEANEGKTMGAVLPVLFLAIAVLTMITTMNRITIREKTQIGILKALGFRDRTVVLHYTSFAGGIAFFGILLGIPAGYGVARYIMNPKGMMGTYFAMPEWNLYLTWWMILVIALIFLLILFIGYLSVRRMLAGSAADALRPYVPKKMRRLLIEKSRLFAKLDFGARWNLRDILRHKSRTLMSLLGVVGCMVLLVGAFGMSDTARAFVNTYYDRVTVYSSRISIPESMSDEEALAIEKEYQGDHSATIAAEAEGESLSLEIYSIQNGNYGFIGEKNEILSLPQDGALVCLRLADKLGLKAGDRLTVSPYGTDERYEIRVGGVNRSLYESISLSEEYARTLGLTESEVFRIGTVYTKAEKSEILASHALTVQSKQDIIDSFDGFMEILNLSIGVLIVAAVALGLIVLYNLGVMSYMERYREMATLKVVGFRDKAIGRLLIGQNLWISLVGILIGFIAGVGVLEILLHALAGEYEMRLSIGPMTFLVSVALTLGVSLFVGWLVARKNRKIDMVSALKAEE